MTDESHIGDLSAGDLDAGNAFIAGRTIETAATGSGSGSDFYPGGTASH